MNNHNASTKANIEGVRFIDEYQFGPGLLVEKYTLDNDLKIILHQDHSAPVFCYHTWFNVGSRNERDGITGIAHLFEHLMFKETKNHKEGEFDRILEEQGGSINAATYLDWTFYRESIPKKAFDLIPMLEADRMEHMILSSEQLESEREVVANERRMRIDNNPSGQMYEKLYQEAFTKHPYHWPIIGWMKDIEGISLEDCLAFYGTYYAPNNASIIIVGDFDRDHALQEIHKRYGHMPKADIPKENISPEPTQTQERSFSMELSIPSPKLLIGYKAPCQTDADHATLSLAHALLVDGNSSRLQQRLIAETGLASSVRGWVDQTKSHGLMLLDIGLMPGKSFDDVLKVIDEEVAKLLSGNVDEQELRKAKNRVETGFWDHFASADDKCQNLGFYETVMGSYQHLFKQMDKLHAVNAQDLKQVATKYYNNNQRTVIKGMPKA